MKITKENGITLISLVVTIVVLLILAGISLNLILGNNGVIAKANDAVRKTVETQVKEELQMSLQNKEMDYQVGDDNGIYYQNPFLPNETVGIDKFQSIRSNGETNYEYDIVISRNAKYYSMKLHINMDNINIGISDMCDKNSVEDNEIALYKYLNNDSAIEYLNDDIFKYNNVNYTLNPILSGTPDNGITTITISDFKFIPMKLKVNSGDDGIVEIFPRDTAEVTINWGDGNSENFKNLYKAVRPKHTYENKNTEYSITIDGILTGFSMDLLDENYRDKLIEIEDWGVTKLRDFDFSECKNLTKIASPRKNTFQSVKNLDYTFEGCESLQNIPSDFFDNIDNVETVHFTFLNCKGLNGKAPNVWEKVPNGKDNNYRGIPDGYKCFGGCTGLENYSQIPDYWKNNDNNLEIYINNQKM